MWFAELVLPVPEFFSPSGMQSCQGGDDDDYDDDDDDAMQGEDGADWNLVPKCALFYPMTIVQFHPIPIPDMACQKTKLGHFSTSSTQMG